MNNNSENLSVPEAAAFVNLKPSTIRAWILQRRIPSVKLGRRVFIRRQDLDALLVSSMRPAIALVSQEAVCL
jgi:excisionase family DNA binding protein